MVKRRRYAPVLAVALVALANSFGSAQTNVNPRESGEPLQFPQGTATPSEQCGVCHVAIYREFKTGFGSDLNYGRMIYQLPGDRILTLPAEISSKSTLHAAAGRDPFPVHARDFEAEGKSCNVCHFPQAFEIPDINSPVIGHPEPRAKQEEIGGVTCASCHLNPNGEIRGPYAVAAPHKTVADPKMRTSGICAYCHSKGERVIGKQTQTFLEWREDFHNPGLGTQHCQDCHMPRTLRKTAENFDVPARAVARHLWTGGHSKQRVGSALSLEIVQITEGRSDLSFHVINIGAGHSVPTGSSRRAIYLLAEVTSEKKEPVSSREWLFAPWYGNRPDDRAFLEADKKRPDAKSVLQADAQGPHESPVRAGEERILAWSPRLKPGIYRVHARLVYDLNRFNDKSFTEDQSEFLRKSLSVKVGAPH